MIFLVFGRSLAPLRLSFGMKFFHGFWLIALQIKDTSCLEVSGISLKTCWGVWFCGTCSVHGIDLFLLMSSLMLFKFVILLQRILSMQTWLGAITFSLILRSAVIWGRLKFLRSLAQLGVKMKSFASVACIPLGGSMSRYLRV